MSITLGGVSLDNSLILSGTVESPEVVTNVRRTLTGRTVINVAPNPGKVLTLTTTGPNGWMYGKFTREALEGIAAVRDAGLPVTLDYRGDIHTVFLLQDCINVTLIIGGSLPQDGDWFSGAVTMLEV